MHRKKDQDQVKHYKVFIACIIFLTTLFIINLIHSYEKTISQMELRAANGAHAGQKKLHVNVSMLDAKKFTFNPEMINVEKEFKHKNITREELGHQSWTLLHLMTANFPEPAEADDQEKFELFLHLFAYFYPCKECGKHFLELLKENRVMASSREEAMGYLCMMHNEVNKRLKKPTFQCQSVVEYWGGDCGCKNKTGEEGENVLQESDRIDEVGEETFLNQDEDQDAGYQQNENLQKKERGFYNIQERRLLSMRF